MDVPVFMGLVVAISISVTIFCVFMPAVAVIVCNAEIAPFIFEAAKGKGTANVAAAAAKVVLSLERGR